MSDHRDRVEFVMDEHVKAVLEFMQENIPTAKLIGIADCLPQMGRLLWGKYRQEPFDSLRIESESATKVADRLRLVANESSPERQCVGGDSAAAACV
jgi:hypothetical protein